MCHVYALSKGQLQQLVPERNRFIYYVHIEFAGVVSKLFKFIDLKLDAERRILHFKCSCDFPVRNKLMDYPTSLKYYVSLSIGCFILVTAVLFTFKFQHFRSHHLLNNIGLYMRFKK